MNENNIKKDAITQKYEEYKDHTINLNVVSAILTLAWQIRESSQMIDTVLTSIDISLEDMLKHLNKNK